MSLVSEIKNSIRYLKDSRKAVSAVGGDISNAAGLKDLPRGIRSVMSNLSLGYYVSEETEFATPVPKNSEEYALIKKVGGMTYKCNNLITFPYNTTIVSGEERDGITITINADGSLTVNGKATKTVTRYYVSKMPITAGTYTFSTYGINAFSSVLSLRNKDTSNLFANRASLSGTTPSKTFTVTEEEAQNNYVYINVYVYADTEVNNETIYPMLNVGDTALPYEPYFEGLRDTKVTRIESRGAGYFDSTNFDPVHTVGAYVGKSSNGRIDINCVSKKQSNAKIPLDKLEGTEVNICAKFTSTGTNTGALQLCYYDLDNRKVTWQSDKVLTVSDSEITVKIPGKSNANDILCLILYGNYDGPLQTGVKVTYENIWITDKCIDKFDIPSEILETDGYGESNPDNADEYNYIDFQTGEFVAMGYVNETGNWIKYRTAEVTNFASLLNGWMYLKVTPGGYIKANTSEGKGVKKVIKFISKTGG